MFSKNPILIETNNINEVLKIQMNKTNSSQRNVAWGNEYMHHKGIKEGSSPTVLFLCGRIASDSTCSSLW